MSERELVILGSASQTPTRHRNHNGYLLRWDDCSVLFDPGEGTQRQLLLAGPPPPASATSASPTSTATTAWACPASSNACPSTGSPTPSRSCSRLRDPSTSNASATPRPIRTDSTCARCRSATTARLDGRSVRHRGRTTRPRPETFGWRVVEPDGIRMLPDRLASLASRPRRRPPGRHGVLERGDRRIDLAEVSDPDPVSGWRS